MDLSVIDCPLSIVGFEGVIDGVPNAELTVIRFVADVFAYGVDALSVTL